MQEQETFGDQDDDAYTELNSITMHEPTLYVDSNEHIMQGVHLMGVSPSEPVITDKSKKYKQDIIKLTNHMKQLNLSLLSKNKLIKNLQAKVSEKKQIIQENSVKASITHSVL